LTKTAIESTVIEKDTFTMNVSLTPELEHLVNEKVASGLYQTASEVVREALRLMKGRDDLARLRADVQVGFDEVARGEGIEYTRSSGRRLADDIKARGRSARAAKR
jgi:antitoxin ParD1/3/4